MEKKYDFNKYIYISFTHNGNLVFRIARSVFTYEISTENPVILVDNYSSSISNTIFDSFGRKLLKLFTCRESLDGITKKYENIENSKKHEYEDDIFRETIEHISNMCSMYNKSKTDSRLNFVIEEREIKIANASEEKKDNSNITNEETITKIVDIKLDQHRKECLDNISELINETAKNIHDSIKDAKSEIIRVLTYEIGKR